MGAVLLARQLYNGNTPIDVAESSLDNCTHTHRSVLHFRRQMKEIELTHGLFTIVDDSDFEVLIRYNWLNSREGGEMSKRVITKEPEETWEDVARAYASLLETQTTLRFEAERKAITLNTKYRARIAELEAQLAIWVRLGRRMSAVISEPDNVELWPLTCLWKDIDDTIASAQATSDKKGEE